MTKTEVKEMIASTGLPYAYHHFAVGEIPQLPYIVYLYPESDNFGADDGVYFKTDNLQIELYESKRDFAAESILESVLDDAELFYEKTEVWIEEDRVYEIIYELEMM